MLVNLIKVAMALNESLALGEAMGTGAESWMNVVAPSFVAVVAPATAAFEAIPAESPIGGPFWTVVLPAALFAVSFVATFLLYRRFAAETSGSTGDGESD